MATELMAAKPMAAKAIVLDANILIRATLGVRSRSIIRDYSMGVSFLVPFSAWLEAEKHLALLAASRNQDPENLIQLLRVLAEFVSIVGEQSYENWREVALNRLARRDPADWPILACALEAKCPIWTEDSDFFGCGVATWTSDRVEMYLHEAT